MKSRTLLLLLFICALCGCKPSKPGAPSYPPPTRTVFPFEVVTALGETNIAANSFALPDGKYLIPTLRWIENDFSKGLWQFQNEMGISTWSAESNDCDKFAIAASFYAKWLNHSSPNRNIAAGLAIGELYYLKGGVNGQGHAINFIVTLVGDSLQIVFYEPQLRRVVSLSETERGRVMFWKL